MDSAGGRWRIGYQKPTTEQEDCNVNKEFLQSMNGILHNNKRRTAGKAWSSGRGYSKNTRMRGNPWTTLCPAPMYKNLTEGLWFPNNSDAKAGNRLGAGAIIFDTYVRGDIDADQSLKKISGADIYNTSWGCWDWNSSFKVRGFFYLRFDYDNMKGTGGKIKVFGEKVRNWERKWGKGRGMDANRKAPSSTSAHPENIKNWIFN